MSAGSAHTEERSLITVACSRCPVCDRNGEILYADLKDPTLDVPERWACRVCRSCQAFWLDPRPAPESLDCIYPPAYLTHSEPRDLFGESAGSGLRFDLKLEVLRRAYGYPVGSSRALGRIAGALAARMPSLRRRIGYAIRFVPAGPGPFLDVGCGNGAYLLTMSSLGWAVRGIEPDPAAARMARSAGLDVDVRPLESVSLPPQ